jgi:hypothetical protein
VSPVATKPLFEAFAETQPDSSPCDDGRLTLEERISRVWEGLGAVGTADCPVCRGRMERKDDCGHCATCGSTLE